MSEGAGRSGPEPRVALVHDWLTGMRGGERRSKSALAADVPYRLDPRLAFEYAAVSAASGLAYGTVMAFELSPRSSRMPW